MSYNPLSGKFSWTLAPVSALLFYGILFTLWLSLPPAVAQRLFDCDGASPVELMTLPLFAAIIPLVWLCPPVSGPVKRKCLWSAVFSVLAAIAIVRETDLHKILFAQIWPEVASSFKGTVFKMKFLSSPGMPVCAKIFVAGFFALFFAFTVIPLARWIWPILKGIPRLQPVAWTMAGFGAVGVTIQFFDRFPSIYRKGSMFGKAPGTPLNDSASAFFTIFEEGGEMLMALLALLAILQAYAIFSKDNSAAAAPEI